MRIQLVWMNLIISDESEFIKDDEIHIKDAGFGKIEFGDSE